MKRARRCNHCGRELNMYDEEQNFAIHTTMGYGSENDGEVVDLIFCCECADDLIAECIISPLEGGGLIRL